jgi:hypothetical protein
MACQAARGDFIAHWDDDDWMPPHRISCQMAALRADGSDMCGLDHLTFFDVVRRTAWRYLYPRNQRPWLAGATLCYRRSAWEAEPFQDISNGEDTRFVWRRRPCKVLALPQEEIYVAILHGTNTSSRRTHSRRWQSHDVKAVRHVIGDDWAFYESLYAPRQ